MLRREGGARRRGEEGGAIDASAPQVLRAELPTPPPNSSKSTYMCDEAMVACQRDAILF